VLRQIHIFYFLKQEGANLAEVKVYLKLLKWIVQVSQILLFYQRLHLATVLSVQNVEGVRNVLDGTVKTYTTSQPEQVTQLFRLCLDMRRYLSDQLLALSTG
jgi:hypothetical protein